MKAHRVIFIDKGNCEIYETVVEAYGFKSAFGAAKLEYVAAKNKASDVAEVRISIVEKEA